MEHSEIDKLSVDTGDRVRHIVKSGKKSLKDVNIHGVKFLSNCYGFSKNKAIVLLQSNTLMELVDMPLSKRKLLTFNGRKIGKSALLFQELLEFVSSKSISRPSA